MFKKTEKQIEAIDVLSSTARHVMLFGGSRSGKTFINLYAIISRAMKCPESRHAVFRLEFSAVKRSIVEDTFPKLMKLCFPDLILGTHYTLNRTDWFARFWNGSEIWFCGLDQGERVEKVLGMEFSTEYFNECSELPYSSVVKAMTRLAQKNTLKKKILYDCNPPSKKHWSYRMFIDQVNPKNVTEKLDPEDYRSLLMNPTDNMDNIDEEYLKILASLPDEERNRFLLGLFSDGVDGAVYSKELGLAERSGRIGKFEYDPEYYVNAVFDIGVSDYTSIFWWQHIGKEIRIIDYYQNNRAGWSHYNEVLKSKQYKYAMAGGRPRIFFPHDGRNQSWSTGLSRRETAENDGWTVEIVPSLSIQDGINAVRTIFDRVTIDNEKCVDALECLSSYHYEHSEKTGTDKNEPCHDWSSHAADSLRYLACVSVQSKGKLPPKPEDKFSNLTKPATFADLMKENGLTDF